MIDEPPRLAIPHWVRVPEGIAFSDVPSRPSDRLPDFIIVGAAKAGTTAVDRFLCEHPKISMCSLKEPHFFSADLIFDRGLDWYKGLYADAQPDQICGEASTSYTRWPSTPLTPQRIHQFIPNTKLLYLVREPVARVISECLQTLKYSRYVLKDPIRPPSVDALLKYILDEKNALAIDPIHTSEYIVQIEEYLKYFGEDQLLVLEHQDLIDHPRETLTKIFAFLGVEDEANIDFNRHYNVTEDFVRSLKYEQLGSRMRRVPGYRLVRKMLPLALKQVVFRSLSNAQVIEPMSDTTRHNLAEHFKPYNSRLADYLGVNLSKWNIL